MSTLPEITESLCAAYLRGEWTRLPGLCAMAAAKMQGDRGTRLQDLLASRRQGPQTLRPQLVHWNQVHDRRWAPNPERVEVAVGRWIRELRHADRLVEAGERLQPLLLVGPTRCGKTSSAARIAADFGLSLFRLSLAAAVDSHLGETAKKMRAAFSEMSEPAVWLIDELDAVAMTRAGAHDAGDKERAYVVGWLLTALDELHASTPLVATTNTIENIDPAIVARFRVVEWPKWEALTAGERERFAEAHGSTRTAGSYAEAVANGRMERIDRILSAERTEAAE